MASSRANCRLKQIVAIKCRTPEGAPQPRDGREPAIARGLDLVECVAGRRLDGAQELGLRHAARRQDVLHAEQDVLGEVPVPVIEVPDQVRAEREDLGLTVQ